MTDASWNPDDYLLDCPDAPPYAGYRTEAPLLHKVSWVTNFLHREVLREAHKAASTGSELAGLLLALAAVDYLAGYLAGKESTGADYEEFIERYLPQAYGPLKHEIYVQLRCGLMHNLVCLNPWKDSGVCFLISRLGAVHLSPTADGQTTFSVLTFIQDVGRAWVMYMHDLIMHGGEYPGLVDKFERRFNRLGGRGAFMVKVPD